MERVLKRIQPIEWILAGVWMGLHTADAVVSSIALEYGAKEIGLLFGGEVAFSSVLTMLFLSAVVAVVILASPKINARRWLTILNIGQFVIVCYVTGVLYIQLQSIL